MLHARRCLSLLAVLVCGACSGGGPAQAPPATASGPATPQPAVYVPQAQYCVNTSVGTLCSTIPGNIGPDPILDEKVAYNGIVGNRPTSAATDAQTPFDNLSWQTFVALNWTKGKETLPPQQGLQGNGTRVWESWKRVSSVFGNSTNLAKCQVPVGMPVFQIGSDGKGKPVGQNEEYIQAATGDPAIDVAGNWTLYERRLNDIEITYLNAPSGNLAWNLATWNGQGAFIKAGQTVNFPSYAPPPFPTGAIEIKAAWRILNPAQREVNATKYYVISAMLTVAPDLVLPPPGIGPQPICAQVDLGLVAMHIIQKNIDSKNNLRQQWFWSTFEHVDNVPMAQQACNPAEPTTCKTLGQLACPAQPVLGVDYSYYNTACPNCPTNQPPDAHTTGPQFVWNTKQPYARDYLRTAQVNGKPVTVGTQISRCWDTYSLTKDLNAQWRNQLRAVNSVFQNYMLVGTQWGGVLTSTPDPRLPPQVVPNFLSNSIVETYLQTMADPKNPFNNGSCVTCHLAATLKYDGKTPSNLSFLPDLVKPNLVRRDPIPPQTTTSSQ